VTRSERLLYPALVLLTTVTGVTGSLGAPLVPSVAAQEHVSLSTAQWILTGPFVLGAVAAPVVGRLGSGRRRRPVLVATIAAATLGTVIAALPLGIAGMIAGRTIQGLAFAVSPLLFAVARDFLPAATLRRAMATLSVANVAAAGLGYPVTATIVELAGLRTAFWAGSVIMAAALLVAVAAIPASSEEADPGVDLVGAAILMLGSLGLLLVISQGVHWGYGSARAVVLTVVSLGLLVTAYRWFRRVERPLVDVALATSPGVLGLHVAAVLIGCGAYILLGSVMILVQADPRTTGYGLGLSIVVAGAMLLPYAVGSFAGNRVALLMASRVGSALVLPLGCVVFAVGNVSLALWHQQPWQVVLAMVIGGVGSGFTFNSVPWLMIQLVSVAETGAAMGLNIVLRFVGFALGSAIATAVIEGLATSGGRTSQRGFTTAMGVGAGICLVAAAASSWLLRASQLPQTPTATVSVGVAPELAPTVEATPGRHAAREEPRRQA
jgi:MFS family permease